MSKIKIDRARKASKIGKFPRSFNAMVAAIPSEAISALTSKQIAIMIDAIWDACQRSKGIAERDACTEGAVWDAKAGKLREISA